MLPLSSSAADQVNDLERLLTDTAARGQLHHAIIFHGPDAAELRRLAIRTTTVLNCARSSGEDGCVSCQKIARDIHPDVHTISVRDEKKLISIEQVRDLVSGAALKPYEGKFKVYIIEAAEAMSEPAANALLKTLEEPVGSTIFMLLTRSADQLLPTIRSRSQSLSVPPVNELVDDQLRREIIARLTRFAERSDGGALLGIAAAIAGADDVQAAIATWTTVLRDIAGSSGELQAIRSRIEARSALEAATRAMRASTRLAVNADVRLLIEQSAAALQPLV